MEKKSIDEIYAEYKKEKSVLLTRAIPLNKIAKAKRIYPLTKLLLRTLALISGEKIEWLHKETAEPQTDKTIIFVNTHRFKPDFEKITIKTKRPSFVIASDFKNSYGTISGWYFNTRPTIFVDPYSKEDKENSYEMMKKYLKSGLDCTILPEAVWNLSENKPVLETFFGSVKVALETDSMLVCTAIERYGKKYILNRSNEIDLNDIVRKYIDFDFDKLDYACEESGVLAQTILCECNQVMRDIMATLLWEIWEGDAQKHGIVNRSEIASDYWERFIISLVSEWSGYRMQDNVEQRYHSKFEIELNHIKKDLESISVSKHNAFLFDKRNVGKVV